MENKELMCVILSGAIVFMIVGTMIYVSAKDAGFNEGHREGYNKAYDIQEEYYNPTQHQEDSYDTLGYFEKGECVNLKQMCANCSYIYISSVKLPEPNSTYLYIDDKMDKNGTRFNYTFCETDLVGMYEVMGYGDLDGVDNGWGYEFWIKESSKEDVNIIIDGEVVSNVKCIVLEKGIYFNSVDEEVWELDCNDDFFDGYSRVSNIEVKEASA